MWTLIDGAASYERLEPMTAETTTVGFIGFGEAAECFSRALGGHGGMNVLVYCEGQRNRPPYTPAFTASVASAGGTLMPSLQALVEQSDLVISAVVVSAAESVGRNAAAHMRPGQVLVDINATTPSVKRRIAEPVLGMGGEFVDANLMGAVSLYGHRVQLLASGTGVTRFKEVVEPAGFRVEDVGPDVGTAAGLKMVRSVVTKGMEALIVEAMIAAEAAGMTEAAMDAICGPMDATTYRDFAEMCIKTDVLHAGRRADEMRGVADGLRDLGVEPLATLGAVARLEASASLGLREQFIEDPPASFRDVLAAYTGAVRGPAGTSRAG